MEKWIVGQPGGPSGPFYSVVSSGGNIIAMQVPDEVIANRLAALPALEEDNMHQRQHIQDLLTRIRSADKRIAELEAALDDLKEENVNLRNALNGG